MIKHIRPSAQPPKPRIPTRYLDSSFSHNRLFGKGIGNSCTDVCDVPRNTMELVVNRGTLHLDALPDLKRLRRLSLSGISDDVIAIVSKMKSLQIVSVRSSACTDLSPLGKLTKLKCLLLQRLGKVTSVDFFSGLTSLEALEVGDLLRITDLTPLSTLSHLQELKIDTGGMRGKQLTVKTLMPLAELTALRHLWLFVLSADKSLEGLGHLNKLRQLNINGHYPWQEYAKLAGCLPRTKSDWLRRKYIEYGYPTCRKCGAKRMIAPPGKGRRVFCGECYPEKIATLVTDYDEQVAIGAEGYW